MELLDNISRLLGDDLKQALTPGARLKVAASCFSMYAFEALKAELEKIEELNFVFTSPTFVANEVTDKIRKERKEFHIPKLDRERSLYGSEFEIQLRNKLTQRAVAKECADWIRRKAKFRSNRTKAPMQQFACVQANGTDTAYMPLHGFTAVDLGYQQGNAVSNLVNKMDEAPFAATYLSLFDQIWNDPEKLEDVTEQICEHIASVYQENSPESIYFLMLYNIFNEFLDDINEDVLPNDRTGYQDTLIWNKLFNYQKDAATGIINKLETYSGCILADSVGLGKTFTALAVVKYYELRNRSVLVLCPKKLADNWLNYNRNLKTNIFARDRFNYDVLCHTDLSRTSGESFGTPLNRINWGNYDLVVIDESHNFRNNDAYKDKETRYQKLMRKVIQEGVKTKVLMLSATPVNNRFTDLRNQLALAYEGDSEKLTKKLRTDRSVEEIFRGAQAAFNSWSKLPPEERTARAILDSLDFDFFELLDSVTIARSRKHIQTFYDTKDIGQFPERRKPLSFHCPLTERSDVLGFNEIFEQLSMLKLAVYAPISYILPSRLKKYEAIYDTKVGSKGTLRQADREKSLQALMTVNLLKRLESSVQSFRLFIYNSKQLHHLESFSSDAGINVMVINVQAFAARGADNRRIYDVLDDFQSRKPIDVISANRPILILDEPQKMEGAATLKSLEEFKALMVLRYSATHKTAHNKIHRLDALDAYNQKLVKKIAVRGIAVKGLAGTAGYLYLQTIEISSKKPPEARVEFEQKLAGGSIKRIVRKLSKGDNLFDLSNGLDQYRDGFVVADINANSDTLSFTNGVELTQHFRAEQSIRTTGVWLACTVRNSLRLCLRPDERQTRQHCDAVNEVAVVLG